MKKKFDLEQLQNAHGVDADTLFPTLSTRFDACPWGVSDNGAGRLIQRKPVSGMPQDLEGKRRYLAQLMPRLQAPSLVRALDVMLASDQHVQYYCEPYSSDPSPTPRRPRQSTCQTTRDLCTEPKWRGELAALAVGEAMGQAESVSDPLGETGRQTVTRQLTALCTWLWPQHEAGQHLNTQLTRHSFDEFDQSDPFEDDHITKVIGDDGEPVRLHRRADPYGAAVPDQGRQNTHLVVMLRGLALHEALYARVLAQVWGIPLEQVGLEPDWGTCKEELVLLAHVLCWSRSACASVKVRHSRGRSYRYGQPHKPA